MKTIPWKATALLPLALAAGFGGGCVGNIGDSALAPATAAARRAWKSAR